MEHKTEWVWMVSVLQQCCNDKSKETKKPWDVDAANVVKLKDGTVCSPVVLILDLLNNISEQHLGSGQGCNPELNEFQIIFPERHT